MLPLKSSKKLNLFFVPVLAHEEVLNTLLFLHVRWIYLLTCMHNVLVPNIAKRAGKRVPSPQKINYNIHILNSSHFVPEKSVEHSLCKQWRRGTFFFFYGSHSWSHQTWKDHKSLDSIRWHKHTPLSKLYIQYLCFI